MCPSLPATMVVPSVSSLVYRRCFSAKLRMSTRMPQKVLRFSVGISAGIGPSGLPDHYGAATEEGRRVFFNRQPSLNSGQPVFTFNNYCTTKCVLLSTGYLCMTKLTCLGLSVPMVSREKLEWAAQD